MARLLKRSPAMMTRSALRAMASSIDGVEGGGEVVEARLEAVLLVAEVVIGGVDEGRAHGR